METDCPNVRERELMESMEVDILPTSKDGGFLPA
jgi:hypothetical protein